MKRIILTAVALSLVIMPTAFAAERSAPHALYQPVAGVHLTVKKPGPVVVKKQVIVTKKQVVTRQPVSRNHWNRGGRLNSDQRKHVIRDYRHAGLKAPGRGQQWVQVDNDYLLVGVASGIIAGIIAGH